MKTENIKQIGIYKIENKINYDFYIGSSRDLKRREKDHFSLLKKNKNKSKILQRAVNKYGIENFKFIIIENCNINDLFILEQKYVDELNPKYNICKTDVSVPIGLEHVHGYYKDYSKYSSLAKNRLIENKNFGWKSKRIAKLNDNKEIIKEYNSLKDYANEYKCSVANISKSIKKEQRCKGYYIKYI